MSFQPAALPQDLFSGLADERYLINSVIVWLKLQLHRHGAGSGRDGNSLNLVAAAQLGCEDKSGNAVAALCGCLFLTRGALRFLLLQFFFQSRALFAHSRQLLFNLRLAGALSFERLFQFLLAE